MKHIQSILLLSFLGMTMAATVLAQQANLKPYGLESGIIEYKYSGASEGVGTLYFDDFGSRSNLYMDVLENGKREKGYTLTIGEYQYLYSPESSEGMKMQNPIMKSANENSDVEAIAKAVYEKMGFEKTGTETFLGKECDVWKGKKGYALLWNGILLKMDQTHHGQHVMQEATSIKVNVAVDQQLLEIPDNIEFMEMPMFQF